MSYIETKIAKKEDVIAVAKDGIKMEVRADFSELEAGWRLEVLYQRAGQYYSYQGRLFRAPSQGAAFEHARKQFARLLGEPRAAARKFSAGYLAARDALEKKIEEVWATADKAAPNVIPPRPIKFDWIRREPRVKATRGTTIEGLEARYNPEWKAYLEASLAEVPQDNG